MRTPIRKIGSNLLVKLECNNIAGSHKVRAARYILNKAVEAGRISPGLTTIIEKTGGILVLVCWPLLLKYLYL